MTILTVEDNRDLQLFYSKVFGMWGYHSVASLSVADAREKLGEGLQPDLILLDLTLPDGSAESLKAELDSLEFANYPIALMSGRDDLEIWGQRLGARRVFMKPVDLPLLKMFLKELEGEHRPRLESQPGVFLQDTPV